MNFGIIGYGNIARKFEKSITYTTGTLYAIGSRSVDEKEVNVRVYRDYEELLNDENIDAIYIALPHLFHKEWIIKSLKHHKAVLCEKPMVLDSKDIDEIKEEVYKNDAYCLEAFKTKFNDGFTGLKDDLKIIGKIESIYCNFAYDGLGRVNDYLFDPRQGGALNDIGSYVVGFILGLVDAPIDHISSYMEYIKGVDSYFKASLYFTNGIEGIVEGAIDRNKDRYALIKGDKGTIRIPYYNRIIDYTINIDTTIERHYPISGDDMTKEIQTLIDDVTNHQNESQIHSLDDSKYLQEVIELIRKEANK